MKISFRRKRGKDEKSEKKQNSKIEVLFTFLVKTELFFKVCGINQIGQYRIINGTCFGSDTFTIITREYQKLLKWCNRTKLKKMIILIIDNPIRSGAVPNIWSVQLSQRPCSKSAQMCTIQNPFYDQCSFFLKKCLQQMVACTKRRETLQPTRKNPKKKIPYEPFNLFATSGGRGK